LLLPEFQPVFIPIEPYERVFRALEAREVDAALLIHEGRLTYEREGLARIVDIGEAWSSLTQGLPLPLGGNAIRRGLGAKAIGDVSNILRDGIRYALTHRDELIDELLRAETRRSVNLDRAGLDRYLAMYANADTLEYPDDARRAVDELYRRGRDAGFLPPSAQVDWAP
jgi:1,4-dihydroxy-6-naphthoate synthase